MTNVMFFPKGQRNPGQVGSITRLPKDVAMQAIETRSDTHKSITLTNRELESVYYYQRVRSELAGRDYRVKYDEVRALREVLG